MQRERVCSLKVSTYLPSFDSATRPANTLTASKETRVNRIVLSYVIVTLGIIAYIRAGVKIAIPAVRLLIYLPSYS